MFLLDMFTGINTIANIFTYRNPTNVYDLECMIVIISS